MEHMLTIFTIINLIINLGVFAIFELKKPSVRDFLPLVVVCAAASLGRVIFSFIPQVQPVTALVIITGSAYGSLYGYVTGSLCALMNVMLKDSVLTADSMTARGYGSKHRRLYDRYSFSIRDIIFIFISALLFICAVFFSQIIIPLILAPLFYNLYEEILWKYYQLKI